MISKTIIHITCCFCAMLLLGGCANKKVQITSEPSGATVRARPIVLPAMPEPGESADRLRELPVLELGTTPLEYNFNFGRADQYDLIVSLPLYEKAERIVTLDPKTEKTVHFELKQFAREMPLLQFFPARQDGVLQMNSRYVQTLAHLDEFERSANVRRIQRVTANEDAAELLGKPVLSPTEDLLLFEVYFERKTTANEIAKRGDTYFSIAEANGLTFEQLVESNSSLSKKKPEDKANAGEVLRIETMGLYSNIWKQQIGSFARSRVTEGRWQDMYPAFTSDGQYLLFSSNRTSPNPTLWRKRIDGRGGNTRVTTSTSGDFHPSVSKSNDMVAYMSLPRGAASPQIWTVNSTGGLTSQLREGYWPRISPDGQRILFLRPEEESGNLQIWVMSVDGTNETQLTQNDNYNIIDPRWSPDGQWIIYAADEEADEHGLRNYDIWIISSNGATKMRLTTNGSHDDGPMFDRTGQYVYFRSNRGGLWNIWRAQPVLNP